MVYDAVIIGGGLSGLAAGVRLAHFGRNVCLLEKQPRLGGLNSYYTLKGRQIDVGLHAITNYVPRHIKTTPLPKILRQLRIPYNDLELFPQTISCIRFLDKEINFTNDFNFLLQEIADKFPKQIDQFVKLSKSLSGYEGYSPSKEFISSRKILHSFLSDPLLIEMILCPTMFYGSSWENDVDFPQFSILFRSLFCEGLACPRGGMRKVISLLKEKYLHCGGELKTNCQVQKLITSDNQVTQILLNNGEIIKAQKYISSIGLPETKTLCSDLPLPKKLLDQKEEARPGNLSFIELILILDTPPVNYGLKHTITFYNDTEHFLYQRPQELVDLKSGVICCPSNYQIDNPSTKEGMVRLTHLANYHLWKKLTREEYQQQKEFCLKRSQEKTLKRYSNLEKAIKAQDIFTPLTIEKFTGRINGAIYGSPLKAKDGRTNIKNLFICGTDQGFLGIIGTMLSGITIANQHILY